MNKALVISALLALVVVGGVYVYVQKAPSLGQVFYQVQSFREGVYAGINRQFAVTRTGSTTVPAIRLDAGSYINEHSCATATWNPGAFSSTTQATTSITLTGAALGDVVLVSFGSATSTELWFADGQVTSANTVTAGLFPANSLVASTNLTTSTLRACYFGY